MFVEILVFLMTMVVLMLLRNRKPPNYPPGPFCWPIFGNIFHLGQKPYVTLMEMRERYGDIIAMGMGGLRGVVISDYKLIKEAASMHEFSGRPLLKIMNHPDTGERRGLIFTEGPQWVEQRRFVLKNLRDFGFGKKSMETLVQDEITELVENLSKEVGKPICTDMKFNVAVVNALWNIVAGERFKHDDPKINRIISYLKKIVNLAAIQIIFPWLTKISPWLSGHTKYMEIIRSVQSLIQESIDAHKENYQEGGKRDLIDCYLEEMHNAKETSSFFKQAGEHNTVMGVADLFQAGTETTSTTLAWMCFYLCHFPEIQEKYHQCIKEVVGQSRLPSLVDRPNMPYAEALIMEVQRCSVMVPLTTQKAIEDVQFHGFTIPKGTSLFLNLYAAMHDPRVWGDPEVFRPERFLSADSKTIVRHEAFMPFSTGRRVCLGESLAKDELFLFSTSLFQRFRMEFDPNVPKPKVGASQLVGVRKPIRHKLVLFDRNN